MKYSELPWEDYNDPIWPRGFYLHLTGAESFVCWVSQSLNKHSWSIVDLHVPALDPRTWPRMWTHSHGRGDAVDLIATLAELQPRLIPRLIPR